MSDLSRNPPVDDVTAKRRRHRANLAGKRLPALFAMTDRAVPKDAMILDFGCGSGLTTYALIDLGYKNVYGFDIQDYLQLRDPSDRDRFQIASRLNLGLPYEDNTFDLILSDQVFEHVKDQVAVFGELYRITKPGGIHLHVIPSPYAPIEPHLRIPLGNFINQRWWFKFWTSLGMRRTHQVGKELTAAEAADQDIFYLNKALNYVSCSAYKVIFRTLGFDYKFLDHEFFAHHWRPKHRLIAQFDSVIPVFRLFKRTFKNRHVMLIKS